MNRTVGTGSFGACRHPNSICFVLYRCFGIALASGSLYFLFGLLGFQLFYFTGTVVPEIEGYMNWKYGETWKVSISRGERRCAAMG